MAQRSDDEQAVEIRERVRQWAVEDGYAVQDLPAPSMVWLLIAHGEQGEFGIGQTQERPAVVSVTGVVDLKATGLRLSEIDDATIWGIRLGLLAVGLDSFSGLARPLSRVTVGADVYCEGMTRNDLAQAMRHVRHGILFLHWSIRQALHEPVTSEGEAGALPS